ncbi:MAG: Gx transporter family protein [Fusobacteriaceae bacterium]
MKNLVEREEVYLTAFVLLSLYLSLAENIIPKPFPWMKIGLSNVVVLFVMEKFGTKLASKVMMLRIIIQGGMMGTLFTPSFIISSTAGIVSMLVMIFLYKYRKYLSLIIISITSAFVHNFIQLIVVYFLMFRNIQINSRGVLIFVFIFLGIGIICGAITGYLVEKINIRKKLS